MAEEIVRSYDKGDTAEVICLVKLYNESTGVYDLTDADSGFPKCTITSSSGSVVVNAQTMTKLSTGKYIYRHNVPSTGPDGWWEDFCDIEVTSGGVTRKERQYGGFNVR